MHMHEICMKICMQIIAEKPTIISQLNGVRAWQFCEQLPKRGKKCTKSSQNPTIRVHARS